MCSMILKVAGGVSVGCPSGMRHRQNSRTERLTTLEDHDPVFDCLLRMSPFGKHKPGFAQLGAGCPDRSNH